MAPRAVPLVVAALLGAVIACSVCVFVVTLDAAPVRLRKSVQIVYQPAATPSACPVCASGDPVERGHAPVVPTEDTRLPPAPAVAANAGADANADGSISAPPATDTDSTTATAERCGEADLTTLDERFKVSVKSEHEYRQVSPCTQRTAADGVAALSPSHRLEDTLFVVAAPAEHLRRLGVQRKAWARYPAHVLYTTNQDPAGREGFVAYAEAAGTNSTERLLLAALRHVYVEGTWKPYSWVFLAHDTLWVNLHQLHMMTGGYHPDAAVMFGFYLGPDTVTVDAGVLLSRAAFFRLGEALFSAENTVCDLDWEQPLRTISDCRITTDIYAVHPATFHPYAPLESYLPYGTYRGAAVTWAALGEGDMDALGLEFPALDHRSSDTE